MAYRHITHSDRERIAIYREEGWSMRSIAKKMNRNVGTISRELSRNTCGNGIGYIPEFAQYHTTNRRNVVNQSRRKIPEGSSLMKHLITKLRARWSPESISAYLKKTEEYPSLSPQTIYQWIADAHPEMKRYLSVLSRRKQKPKGAGKREIIQNRRSIEERPEVINNRERLGDWEGDTVVSGCRKRAMATFTDRASRYLLVSNMSGRSAHDMHRATLDLFREIPKEKRLTCTDDNGTEFAYHQKTEEELGMTIFFAHPYCSYERGSNERNNREIRRFFPKGTDFADIPDWELDWAINLINNKPRKVLNYRTASEVFFDKSVAV